MKKGLISMTLIAALLFATSSCKENTAKATKADSTITAIVDTNKPAVSQLETLVLKSGNSIIKIDPNTGARIVSFTHNGIESLIQASEFEMFGSTFWTAPQSSWGWPPIENLDSKPYHKISDNEYESPVADTIGVTITKKFIANTDSSFSISYTIKNLKDTTIKIAPWEISRVQSGGITIFPTEIAQFKGKKPFGELKITSKNGISLYKYDSSAVTDNKKSFAYASEGWLAQHKGSLLLIKKFDNVKPADCAPDESEIEIYANPNKKFIEIEQQGAYKTLKSKESYTWTVKWFLRKIENKSYTETEYKKIVSEIIK